MSALAVSLAGFGCVFCFICVLWDRLTQPASSQPAAAQATAAKTARGSSKLLRALGTVLAALALAAGAVWVLHRVGVPRSAGLLVVAAAGAWLLVRLWTGYRQRQWRQQIASGLIDVLDLWILCLDAGMSFQAALARVTQGVELARPALRRQLQIALQEMLAGAPRADALKHLARRCQGVPELSGLVAHIVQAEKLGGSLTQTLQVCANTLRFNRHQDLRQQVQEMPVKLAFPLVFCILPCLLIVISAPALIRLFEMLGSR